MNVEEMKARKRELGYTYAMIAEKSGVPVGTVQKVFGGFTKAPRYETLQAIEKALILPDISDMYYSTCDRGSESQEFKVKENAADYFADNGNYSIEDYEKFPEDFRVEMIDGFIYDMSGATIIHQIISSELHGRLYNYIRSRGGKCIPGQAGTDFKLSKSDNRTVVQPDVYVICDHSILTRKRAEGAPTLAIEVLSPSTRKKDMTIKLNKYQETGVKEYWLVDYDKERILVYKFEDDEQLFTIYGIRDNVPVGIFDDDLKIDFAEIDDYIRSIDFAEDQDD